MVQSLVLAGAPNKGKLRTVADCQYEALLPLRGKAMARYVVNALTQASTVSSVTIAGPVPELTGALSDMDVKVIEGGNSLLDTLFRGIEATGTTDRLLVVTSDIPLISAADIDGFIGLCSDQEADFYYPIISKSTLDGFSPGSKRTYVSLTDGCYTGGNVSLINPQTILACAHRIRSFVAARKSPLRLATLLGPLFVLRMMMRKLSVTHLEHKVSRLFGIKAAAVECPYYSIGIDVDKPHDFEFINSFMTANGNE